VPVLKKGQLSLLQLPPVKPFFVGSLGGAPNPFFGFSPNCNKNRQKIIFGRIIAQWSINLANYLNNAKNLP
jgi:hypothetical protein